ncbi:MAG TPA: hypothetical protein PKV38_01700 [bacterium]|nr:hypothetical protein [bacterium]
MSSGIPLPRFLGTFALRLPMEVKATLRVSPPVTGGDILLYWIRWAVPVDINNWFLKIKQSHRKDTNSHADHGWFCF